MPPSSGLKPSKQSANSKFIRHVSIYTGFEVLTAVVMKSPMDSIGGEMFL
jgi:hypothetical protein